MTDVQVPVAPAPVAPAPVAPASAQAETYQERAARLLRERLGEVVLDQSADPTWTSWARGWLGGSARATSREATLAMLRTCESTIRVRDAMLAGRPEDMPGFGPDQWRSVQARLAATEAAMCLARDLPGGALEALRWFDGPRHVPQAVQGRS